MEKTLAVINQLEQEGLIGRYAIGGAVAATRYSAEHLAAIMLKTGRPKDHARLTQFFEFNVLDRAMLEEILARHNLTAKWEDFRKRFLYENG